MVHLVLAAAAGIGAGLGAISNQQRLEEDSAKLSLLNSQVDALNKQSDIAASINRNQMESQALQNTQSSRKNAIQAFQSESKSLSSVGASGTSGGTAFYNLGNQIAENRLTLLDADTMAGNAMRNLMLQGKSTQLGFDQQIKESTFNRDQLQKSVNYENSPLGWLMSTATGAVSGVSTAASLMSIPGVLEAESSIPKGLNSGGNIFGVTGNKAFDPTSILESDTGMLSLVNLNKPQLTNLGFDANMDNWKMDFNLTNSPLMAYGRVR